MPMSFNRRSLTLRSACDGTPRAHIRAETLLRAAMCRAAEPWQARREVRSTADGPDAVVERAGGGHVVRFARLGHDGPLASVSGEANIETMEDGVEIVVTLRNSHASWTLREVETAMELDCGSAALLWPHGLGQRFPAPKEALPLELLYPSGSATMPWFALDSGDGGLYVGSHDPRFGARRFRLESAAGGRVRLLLGHFPYCAPGGVWKSPPLRLCLYRGAWHEAARRYRDWFDTVAERPRVPRWVGRMSGWLLAVLKQQNGDVMWKYADIDRLCDIAHARGLDTLGLFGWAVGGHDRLFPEFVPDPAMGGEPALREALARAKARGIRAILYANGQLVDTAGDFYQRHGNEVILQNEATEPLLSSVRKFRGSTPVTFATACLGSAVWQRHMLALADQALNLGASGILYDQLGVLPPYFCHAPDHLHATPAEAFTTCRWELLRSIRDHAQRKDPEFAVMTEGIHDAVLQFAHCFHGWGYGASPHYPGWGEGGLTSGALSGPQPFPELFRCTFPEAILTHRYAQPGMDRHSAHYACLYGMRLELETRYRADVRYLQEGLVPTAADYGDVTYWPPVADLIRKAAEEGDREYMLHLTDFLRANADLLWLGRFVDTQGFCVSGDCVEAKGFRAGDRLGILLWNPSTRKQTCHVAVAGHELERVASPDGEARAGVLPAETMQLLVFRDERLGKEERNA